MRTYVPPVSARRALEDCERRIAILERALSRYDLTSEVQKSANRAELARLREVREHRAAEVDRIRRERIRFTGQMHRLLSELARQHYREHVELLEESGHSKQNGRGAA
jgi:hypothetical protein